MKHMNIIKNILKGIVAIFLYFFLTIIQGLPLALVGIDANELPSFVLTIYLLLWQVLICLSIGLLFKDEFIKSYKDLKKNHSTYFKKYLKYWFILLIIMMTSNIIISLITNNMDGAKNQQTIVETFTKYPIYMYFAAVVFAPIIEELVFRFALRKIIFKLDILYILLSGLFFGYMHVAGSTTWQEFIYIIPYAVPGVIFAYVYTKCNNIFVPICLHFLHNGVLMALQTLLFITGSLS